MKKCSKHPKYKAQRKPRVDCLECINIWLAKCSYVRKPMPPPTKVIDKRRYSRKQKEHHEEENE